jgi:hypothetical protein
MIVRNENDWLTASLGGEVVLMSVKGDDVISLDEVGAHIWAIIKKPRTLDDVCLLLSEQFAATPEECRPDVQKLLDGLEAQGAALEHPR